MRIIIDIGHPGHVHLFKYIFSELEKKGHTLFFSVREIPVAKYLLKAYNMPYLDLGKKSETILGKAVNVIQQDSQLFRFVTKNKIDFGLSSGIVLSHISKVTKMKSVIFDDDDDKAEPLVVKYGHPFADVVLTPSPIERKTTKSITYQGSHELAYLHPNRFIPDESIINNIGLKKNEKYFLLRFVAFKGHHDGGHFGISIEQKRKIISQLLKYGKVLISAERAIEPEFEQYRLNVPSEKIHSLMYYSSLFIGDSQTMISEAAIMGVPAIKCNSFAGQLSVPNELEKKYGLCYAYHPNDFDLFYNHIRQILNNENVKTEWIEKKNRFLKDKIDVTAFMVWFIENYPESKKIMQKNPDYQYNFK